MLKDESKCFFIDVIDEMIEEALLAILCNNDPLGTCLSHGDLRLFDLGSAIHETDLTLDSIPHLESSSREKVYSCFALS